MLNKLIKSTIAGLASLALIAGPVLAASHSNSVVDRISPAKHSDETVPVVLLVGAAILLVVVLASSGSGSDDKPKSA